MVAFLRALPNAVWWVTIFFAVLALLTQLAIMIARSGTVSVGRLLLEFVFTVALLALPIGIAWRARQQGSLWFALGALALLAAFGRIFFF